MTLEQLEKYRRWLLERVIPGMEKHKFSTRIAVEQLESIETKIHKCHYPRRKRGRS